MPHAPRQEATTIMADIQTQVYDDTDNINESHSRHVNGRSSDSSLQYQPSMEKITSVQDNPFFARFGKKQAAITPRTRILTDSDSGRKRLSSNGTLQFEDEEQIEYKPGSGFVHKLLDKWSTIETRDELPTGKKSVKKSSSLEDLSAEESHVGKTKQTVAKISTPRSTLSKKPDLLTGPKIPHRAQSIENLNESQSQKSHTNNHQHHSRQHYHLRHVDPAWMKNKDSLPVKSPRSLHVNAPDVELARDDIIIIEKTSSSCKDEDKDDANSSISEEDSPPLSYREEILPEELPKPNTVQTVRHIFETNSSQSDIPPLNLFSRRRRPSDTPSLVTTPRDSYPPQPEISKTLSPESSENSIRGLSSLISPRSSGQENYAKPVVSPPVTTTSETFPLWKTSDIPKPSADSTSSSSISQSQNVRPASIATEKFPSLHERSSFFDSPRLGEVRPLPSPRSMASVKPTMATKPTTPVKPLPLSTPASVATSYKGSSPVVPVAPFKDKKEDEKDDGQPVMIFSKSKISPKREKPQRIKDYTPVNNTTKDVWSKTEEESKTSKSGYQNNNRLSSLKKTVIEDKKSPTDEGDKIISTSTETTIQIGSFRKSDSSHEGSNNLAGRNQKSVDLVRTSENSAKLASSMKKTQAPSAPKDVKLRKAPMPPESKAKQTSSMLYISSSENSETDSSTPPETPRTTVSGRSDQGLKSLVSDRSEDKSMPRLVTTSKTDNKISTNNAENIRSPSATISISGKTPSYNKSVETNQSSKYDTSSPSSIVSSTSAAKDPAFPSLYKQNTANKELTKESIPTTIRPNETKTDTHKEAPIKGIPSIIAKRLKKTSQDPSQVAGNVANGSSFLKLDGSLLDESSTDSDVSPRLPLSKPPTSTSPFAISLNSVSSSNNSKEEVSSEIANEIAAVRKKMENAKKSSNATQIFDSSQLAEKRKKRQQERAQAQAAASQGIVPPLDLSGIHEDKNKQYMGPQKEIKPCNIKFIGENAKTDRSLLSKNRKMKANISFNDLSTETFEYPNEDWALQQYLDENPNAKDDDDDVIFMTSDQGVSFSGLGESSDDVDDEGDDAPVTTPRGNKEEETLKSNTALSSSGSLQSYRGRFQEDFQFGASLHKPEPVKTSVEEPLTDDPDSLMLRPADEETTNTWSTSSSSDLLF